MADEYLIPNIWPAQLFGQAGAGSLGSTGGGGAGSLGGISGAGGDSQYSKASSVILSTLQLKSLYDQETKRALKLAIDAQLINGSLEPVAPKGSQSNLPPGTDWGSPKREIDL